MATTTVPAPIFVVLFSGKRFAGKTTSASVFESQFVKLRQAHAPDLYARTVRVSLGMAVKEQYADENKIPLEALITQGPTKAQHLAGLIAIAERERARDPQHWARLAWQRACYKFSSTHPNLVVIDDHRQPEEREFFQTLPGVGVCAIRVSASAVAFVDRGMKYDVAIDRGPTETGLDTVPEEYWAARVENSGSIDELATKLSDVARGVLGVLFPDHQ